MTCDSSFGVIVWGRVSPEIHSLMFCVWLTFSKDTEHNVHLGW